ncbi:MAG: energy transducer TonB [Marinirhabdus sp.]|nr:energy transducer TonB [Marinirhabdus sp.]
MKPSSKKCSTTAKVTRKREDKKGINIRWNSGIFFQVGLIIGLIAMLLVMELKVGSGQAIYNEPYEGLWETPENITFVLEKEVIVKKPETPRIEKPAEPRQPVKPITQEFTTVPDDTNVEEGETLPEEVPYVVEPTAPAVVAAPTETTTIMNVEFVPIFPGCEGAVGNNAKIDCMSSKIRSFIGKRFDSSKFDYYEPGSVQRIYTIFTIDAKGNVVDIQARSADDKLQAEAMRVIEKLPVMTPGKQGAKAVNVTYAVPISFQVNY